MNISGAGTITVWGTTAATITTFNAASNTGGVTVDLSASTGANQTVKGGSGNDTLTVDLARNITLDAGAGNDVVVLANATAANLSSTTGAADSIDGGAGTDTLSVTAAGAVALAGDTAADRAVIKNFEQLRVSNDLNGSTFSIANFGLNYLQIDAATTTAAATVNGFTSGATVEYRANADSTGANGQVNIGMTGATNAGTPDDLLNIKLNANLANQATAADAIEFTAGISGINKLVITTADRDNTDGATARDDGYILNLANDNSLTQMTISGDRELSFTSTASTAALATVDASGLSGDLILNLAVNGLTQGVVVTGGSGANTITGTGFADTITGGARADVITGGAGADTLTGGAGADTFVFAAADYTAASAAALAAAADTITDFGKASDIIQWGANLAVVTNATAVNGVAAINAEGKASFTADDDTLVERIIAVEAAINAGGAAASGQTAYFEFGSDTYVFISEGTDGVGAGDALIKLVGVTGLSDITITGANMTIA
ncbi:beta strand repeat-containing protein [Tepidimonas sp. HKU79]|uniref:beta strand repeat-containing protein n=1 Tax=Tepidimonas sp. HKU79 TaxID=3414505 RepID=UPI003C7C957F